MTPPMIGPWIVRVLAVRPYTIHGDIYYELQVTPDDQPDGSAALVRIAAHAIASAPAVGERLRLMFLMGQVTAANPA